MPKLIKKSFETEMTLSFKSFIVLGLLQRGEPMYMKDLERITGLNRATLKRSVLQLEQDGDISVVTDTKPSAGRKPRICTITAQGLKTLEARKKMWKSFTEDMGKLLYI